MSDLTTPVRRFSRLRILCGLAVFAGLAVLILWPQFLTGMAGFVVWSLLVVAPIVIPGIVLAAWIMASGAGGHIAGVFEGRINHPPLAESWFHVKLEVDTKTVKVFVNNDQQPALEVEKKSSYTDGKIGFWVGNLSKGDFANLEIRDR